MSLPWAIRALSVTPTNVEVVLVERPKKPSIFVLLDRVHLCYAEMTEESWTGLHKKMRKQRRNHVQADNTPPVDSELPPESPEAPESEVQRGPVTRSMTRNKRNDKFTCAH